MSLCTPIAYKMLGSGKYTTGVFYYLRVDGTEAAWWFKFPSVDLDYAKKQVVRMCVGGIAPFEWDKIRDDEYEFGDYTLKYTRNNLL